jgi:DNA modification methylase
MKWIKINGSYIEPENIDEIREAHENGNPIPDPVYPRKISPLEEWTKIWAKEVKRVLKPGAHLVAFGGSRTHHRMMAAIEDAGFEIRDTLMWVYGGGFPKSLDVSKAIDDLKGEDREVVGTKQIGRSSRSEGKDWNEDSGFTNGEVDVTEPASEEAEKWDGWGTALKPGYEPICLARKPLSEDTVAKNVLTHGTGAINIDDCRIGVHPDDENIRENYENHERSTGSMWGNAEGAEKDFTGEQGRWPSNLITDERASVLLDEQGGKSSSSVREPTGGKILDPDKGWNQNSMRDDTVRGYDDEGGVSRFFKSVQEGRWPTNFVLEEEAAELLNDQSGTLHSRGNVNQSTSGGGSGNTVNPGPSHESRHHKRKLLQKDGGAARFFYCPKAHKSERNIGTEENEHPTVKPVELMAYLIRLTTPEGGRTLDPFGGSGTAGISAVLEQKEFTLIEKDGDHAELAEKRIEHVKANVTEIREQIYDDPSNKLTEEGNEVNHDFW